MLPDFIARVTVTTTMQYYKSTYWTWLVVSLTAFWREVIHWTRLWVCTILCNIIDAYHWVLDRATGKIPISWHNSVRKYFIRMGWKRTTDGHEPPYEGISRWDNWLIEFACGRGAVSNYKYNDFWRQYWRIARHLLTLTYAESGEFLHIAKLCQLCMRIPRISLV